MSEGMRKDFEDAYLKQYSRLPLGWDRSIQRYRDAHANGAWWAWQAATLKAFGDGHRAGFESGMKVAHQFEPASAMQDDSPRMLAIGQNGNNGEHYE